MKRKVVIKATSLKEEPKRKAGRPPNPPVERNGTPAPKAARKSKRKPKAVRLGAPSKLVASYARLNVLSAIINPSRVVIMETISQNRCSVGDLAKLIGGYQSDTSHHLSRLRLTGMAQGTRDGKNIYYTLTAKGVKLLALVKQMIEVDREE